MQIEDEIARIFNDPDVVQAAMQIGIDDALLKHKQLGNPICVWREGKVIWIAPEKINVKQR